jgi:hypothetical protein
MKSGMTRRPRKQKHLLITREERFLLLHGPYQPPLVKRGLVVDEVRGTVKFGGFTNARIPWPTVKKTGRASLVLCGDLVRALKTESSPAIEYHWGVSHATVGNWRRSLGLRGLTEGAERLMRIGVELARRPEGRAKIAAWHRGRKMSHHQWARLLAGIKKSWRERRRERRAQLQRGKFASPLHNRTPWVPEEEQLLGKRPDRELVSILGRSLSSIRNRRHQFGIRYRFNGAPKPWTPQQDKLLGTRSDKELAQALGRTVDSIAGRRRILGIRYVRPDSRPWTAAEERWLGRKPDAAVAKMLGRTVKAIQHRRLMKTKRLVEGNA